MISYQSFVCPKCGKAVLRSLGVKYCQYCGAKLPEIKEPPEIVCPMCHGKGRITEQPFVPITWPYGDIMTNKKD